MPYICTKSNTTISLKQERNIKDRLGKAVAILGKPESYLMVNMEENCRLYFGGNREPAAFVEVRLFGRSSAAAYEKMTAEVTKIVAEELGVAEDRIYVQYEEVPTWGFAGSNF